MRNGTLKIDLSGLDHRQANEALRQGISQGHRRFLLLNAEGQRYLACGFRHRVRLDVEGVVGSDTGAFMDGPKIFVRGNAEDALGNTMNAGKLVIEGDAGDVVGYGMRGGRIFIRGNVGYRLGIHMKSFGRQLPAIVVGGRAKDFAGEYMAGGVIVILGLWSMPGERVAGNFIGTGIHGGAMFLRGQLDAQLISPEAVSSPITPRDRRLLEKLLCDFCKLFRCDYKILIESPFTKLQPASHRPFGNLYAY